MFMAVGQACASTDLCTSSRQPNLSCCPHARKQKIQIPATSLKITSTYSEACRHTECIPSYFKRLEIVWTHMLGNAAICKGANVTLVTTVALPAARSSAEWNVWTPRRPVKRILLAVFFGVAVLLLESGPT